MTRLTKETRNVPDKDIIELQMLFVQQYFLRGILKKPNMKMYNYIYN